MGKLSRRRIDHGNGWGINRLSDRQVPGATAARSRSICFDCFVTGIGRQLTAITPVPFFIGASPGKALPIER
jgi:hypothetical protein